MTIRTVLLLLGLMATGCHTGEGDCRSPEEWDERLVVALELKMDQEADMFRGHGNDCAGAEVLQQDAERLVGAYELWLAHGHSHEGGRAMQPRLDAIADRLDRHRAAVEAAVAQSCAR